jgi:thioredoxin 1
LKIYGIPTIIAYSSNQEKIRYVGVKPEKQLKSLFEALSQGNVPASSGLSGGDRFLRLLAGSAVAGVGWAGHYNWFLLVTGSILLFSAVYDRCPVWRAITNQFKKVMAK